MANVLIGQEVEHPLPSFTQVYKVTHDGEGNRLPFMNRSFMSFSFGEDNNGKPVYIEDFNLIVTFGGDRMEKEAYAPFNDLTSEYDVIHGLFYWGTYYKANTLSFILATDGMTQLDLDRFKYWFKAGITRELILAEHPNRAIMARVSETPQLKLLPFEKRITKKILRVSLESIDESNTSTIILPDAFTTSTTVYRGEIELTLVMDEPFWYAKLNILGELDALGNYMKDQWVDANGLSVSIMQSEDALKIIYEDLIPLGSTIRLSVFLGGDLHALIAYEIYSKIEYADTSEEALQLLKLQYEDALVLPDIPDNATMRSSYYRYLDGEISDEPVPDDGQEHTEIYAKGARVYNDEEEYGACIAGAQITGTSDQANGVALPPGIPAYLYYAGTAPAPVKLRFSLKPGFNEQFYIVTPQNKFSDGDIPYNTLTLEATRKHEFKFTLPTFWNNYNQVLLIFENPEIVRTGNAWLTVRETIRDTIRHPIIRAWANQVLNQYDTGEGVGVITDSGTALTTIISALKAGMKELLMDPENPSLAYPATFTFDGRTGEAIGEFSYTKLNENLEKITDISVENVGDMVKSSYLILDERNILDDTLLVLEWSEPHPDYTYKITHDLTQGIEDGLQDLHFEFKNMYL